MVDTHETEGAETGPQEPGNHGNRDVHRPVKRCSEISAKEYSDQVCVQLEKRKKLFFFLNEFVRQRRLSVCFLVYSCVFLCYA